jgi:hypothetical protein
LPGEASKPKEIIQPIVLIAIKCQELARGHHPLL